MIQDCFPYTGVTAERVKNAEKVVAIKTILTIVGVVFVCKCKKIIFPEKIREDLKEIKSELERMNEKLQTFANEGNLHCLIQSDRVTFIE